MKRLKTPAGCLESGRSQQYSVPLDDFCVPPVSGIFCPVPGEWHGKILRKNPSGIDYGSVWMSGRDTL